MNNKDSAFNLVREGRYSEALPILLALIKKNENDGSLHYLAGQCYRFLGDFEKAVAFLSKAEKNDEDEPQIMLALGIAYQLSEKYEMAVTKLQKAIELDNSFFSAINSLGLTFRKMGQLEDALQCYNRAYECLVENIHSKICKPRSLCYSEEVDTDGKKVLNVLPYLFIKTEKELRLNPQCAILHNNIGGVLIDLGKYGEAREQFKQSIEMTPDGFDYPLPVLQLKELENET